MAATLSPFEQVAIEPYPDLGDVAITPSVVIEAVVAATEAGDFVVAVAVGVAAAAIVDAIGIVVAVGYALSPKGSFWEIWTHYY